MSNYLDSLLGQVHDDALAHALRTEVALLRDGKEFGLVFEKHVPESVVLHTHPVRKGATVRLRDETIDSNVWTVEKVVAGEATISRAVADERLVTTAPIADLSVVRLFGSPIFPGLLPVGKVERGGDKPWHAVINGENYHALETLLYAYEGQVDCIYIDPPYNSGASDWKYNNDYVDQRDDYRHSKWLSFMEKRLLLAKRLLNPTCSGLIVTIDEKEVHRLALLLRQVFRESKTQMISTVINPKGVVRANELSRTDEYVFFVLVGEQRLHPEGGAGGQDVPWQQLRRTDIESRRGQSKGGKSQFYPIYVNRDSGAVEALGEPIGPEADRFLVPSRIECETVFPVRDDGTEMNWGLTPKSLQLLLNQGFVKTGKHDPAKPQPFPVKYLTSGRLKDIAAGNAEVAGYEPSGAAIVRYREDASLKKMATTAWARPSHNAQYYGSDMVKALLPDRSFPFPKSLYAVEDALRFLVSEKKDALVLDFFAGSGTTGHALARLNRHDGEAGQRRAILVTNNEVSPEEAFELRAAGHRPGDPDWEAMGICSRITIPRLTAAFTGTAPSGEPVTGDYKYIDEFPMSEGLDENIEFFELSYLDRDLVGLGRAFEAIAPLLWLKAGARGSRIDKVEGSWLLPTSATYGVLFDARDWRDFVQAVATREDVRHIFVVTDSQAVFQQVAAELRDGVDATVLYEDYLTTFEINTRAAS